jgi:hypothetical protein
VCVHAQACVCVSMRVCDMDALVSVCTCDYYVHLMDSLT